MQQIFDDLRSNRPKPLDSCDFNSLPLHKRFISLPNMTVRRNPAAKSSEFRWKSTPNIILPVVNDLQENKQEPSESCDFHSLPLKKRCLSLLNMAVGTTSEGDAPEVGLPQITSVELPVSIDATLMTLASPVEDSGIEMPLSDGVGLVVMDTVTRGGRSDAGTDPAVTAVTHSRPRRSLWSRTKKFVRLMFCCGEIDHADV
ncbi:uncharacterized protein LOC132951087 [Metopolophium dirhodum]|uniref:uncharacterized protein LOC132951087 n=1 Tax=Metopolophium dirhodum TaxID=44670 RepID=UPI00298F5762|nr:uncharacterized protein LOC132951087 [Metopolophium dirhodum]